MGVGQGQRASPAPRGWIQRSRRFQEHVARIGESTLCHPCRLFHADRSRDAVATATTTDVPAGPFGPTPAVATASGLRKE